MVAPAILLAMGLGYEGARQGYNRNARRRKKSQREREVAGILETEGLESNLIVGPQTAENQVIIDQLMSDNPVTRAAGRKDARYYNPMQVALREAQLERDTRKADQEETKRLQEIMASAQEYRQKDQDYKKSLLDYDRLEQQFNQDELLFPGKLEEQQLTLAERELQLYEQRLKNTAATRADRLERMGYDAQVIAAPQKITHPVHGMEVAVPGPGSEQWESVYQANLPRESMLLDLGRYEELVRQFGPEGWNEAARGEMAALNAYLANKYVGETGGGAPQEAELELAQEVIAAMDSWLKLASTSPLSDRARNDALSRLRVFQRAVSRNYFNEWQRNVRTPINYDIIHPDVLSADSKEILRNQTGNFGMGGSMGAPEVTDRALGIID